MPTPGSTILAMVKARLTAIAVVIKYNETVFSATCPIFTSSPIDADPQTKEKNTKGTTSSLREITNTWPTTSKTLFTNQEITGVLSGSAPPSEFSINPKMIPSTIPKRILDESCIDRLFPFNG